MEGRSAAWTFLGVAIGFKAATAVVILIQLNARAVNEAYSLLIATNWPLAVAALVLVAGPVTFWVRLLRARAKRHRLQHGEWHVG